MRDYEAELNQAIASLKVCLSAIDEAIEFAEPYVDVVDGPYGNPQPNDAMSLSQELEQAKLNAELVLSLHAKRTSLATRIDQLGPISPEIRRMSAEDVAAAVGTDLASLCEDILRAPYDAKALERVK